MTGFGPWLTKWKLAPAGVPIRTPSGRFLPVDYQGQDAMLKVVTEPEERGGAQVLAWWAGEGAARVLEHDDEALLLERAPGSASLAAWARSGRDDEATTSLCRVAAILHAKDPSDRPATVVPLRTWFRELWPLARSRGGIFADAATVAERLLTEQNDLVVLHGDLHHENVLDFAARGWLAIDPKGLYGERTFDFVNLLRNPDAELALAPGRFESQLRVIEREARVDSGRLLQWTLAFTCLSAAWIIDDGEVPTLDLAIARLAVTVASGSGAR